MTTGPHVPSRRRRPRRDLTLVLLAIAGIVAVRYGLEIAASLIG